MSNTSTVLALIAAFCARLLACGSVYSWGIFFVHFKNAFGISNFKVSLVLALVQGLMQGIGLLVPILLKRFPLRVVVLSGAVLASLSVGVAGFLTSYCVFATVFGFLQGIGQGLIYVTVPLASSFILPAKHSHVAISVLSAGDGFGMVLFPLLFRFLLEEYSWRQTLLITSAVLFHALVCALILTGHKGSHILRSSAKARPTERFSELRNLNFVLILASALLDSLAFSAYISYIAVHIQTTVARNGIDSLVMSVSGAISIAGRLSVSFLDNRYMPRWLWFAFGHIIQGVATLALVYGPPQIWWLVLWAAVLGLTAGLTSTLLCVVCRDVCGEQILTKAFSYSMFAWGLGSVVGPSMSGLLHDATSSTEVPIALGGVLFLSSGVLLLGLCRGAAFRSFACKASDLIGA